jgi:hypothetical protein
MVKDTSKDYEHLIDYVAKENLEKGSLDSFLDIETEYKPQVKPKKIDSEYPEEWQTLFINLHTKEDYVKFMSAIGSKPILKLTSLVYENPNNKVSVLDFLGS